MYVLVYGWNRLRAVFEPSAIPQDPLAMVRREKNEPGRKGGQGARAGHKPMNCPGCPVKSAMRRERESERERDGQKERAGERGRERERMGQCHPCAPAASGTFLFVALAAVLRETRTVGPPIPRRSVWEPLRPETLRRSPGRRLPKACVLLTTG